MRRGALGAAVVGALVATVSAGTQQGNPTFRGGVDLVTLDVSVIDRSGRPVPHLKAEDFVVELSGEKRPVRVLDYLELASADQSVFGPGRRQSTTGPSAERAVRNIVIAVDDLSFEPGHHRALAVAAERWLETLGSQDMVGVATTSTAALAIAPTRDRGSVTSVLNRIRAQKQSGIDFGYAVTLQEAFDMRAGNIAVRDAVFDRECQEQDIVASRAKAGAGDRDACELRVAGTAV